MGTGRGRELIEVGSPGSESCRSSLEGRDKGLGFYPNYGRTHEVNEIPHVNIHAVPAACAGSRKYWLSLFIDSYFLLEHSFPGPLVYLLPIRHESQWSPFLSHHK